MLWDVFITDLRYVVVEKEIAIYIIQYAEQFIICAYSYAWTM